MADPKLKEAFLSKLRGSTVFKKLKPEEQTKLLSAYENATDEAYTSAMKELEAAEVDLARREETRKQKMEEQVTLSKEINQASKDLGKVVLQEKESKERVESGKKADDLLKQIGAEKKPKKRKKLFGIF